MLNIAMIENDNFLANLIGENAMAGLTMSSEDARVERLVDDIDDDMLVSVLQFMDEFEMDGFVRGQIKSFVDSDYREVLTDGQRERVTEYWSATAPA